jgi:GNAT superfamily N-acetyltransferase
MPLTVESFQFALPDALRIQLVKVYKDTPEFASGESAMEVLEEALGVHGSVLYSGVFNGKHICSVLATGDGPHRQLRYLCVHPANRGRGIARRLMDEVRRLEADQGVVYLEAVFDLRQEGVPEMLLSMGFIPHGEPEGYRCRL